MYTRINKLTAEALKKLPTFNLTISAKRFNNGSSNVTGTILFHQLVELSVNVRHADSIKDRNNINFDDYAIIITERGKDINLPMYTLPVFAQFFELVNLSKPLFGVDIWYSKSVCRSYLFSDKKIKLINKYLPDIEYVAREKAEVVVDELEDFDVDTSIFDTPTVDKA